VRARASADSARDVADAPEHGLRLGGEPDERGRDLAALDAAGDPAGFGIRGPDVRDEQRVSREAEQRFAALPVALRRGESQKGYGESGHAVVTLCVVVVFVIHFGLSHADKTASPHNDEAPARGAAPG
jgi:hypothetical protein